MMEHLRMLVLVGGDLIAETSMNKAILRVIPGTRSFDVRPDQLDSEKLNLDRETNLDRLL